MQGVSPTGSRPCRGGLQPQSGLTLIELVLAISVLAILSAVVLMRGSPAAGRSTAVHQASQVAADLLHARALALTGGRSLQFRSTATGYQVCLASADCSDHNQVLRDPGHPGGRFEVELTHGLSFSEALTLNFDVLGRPQIVSALNLDLQLAGISLVRVTVMPLTGLVSVLVLQ